MVSAPEGVAALQVGPGGFDAVWPEFEEVDFHILNSFEMFFSVF